MSKHVHTDLKSYYRLQAMRIQADVGVIRSFALDRAVQADGYRNWGEFSLMCKKGKARLPGRQRRDTGPAGGLILGEEIPVSLGGKLVSMLGAGGVVTIPNGNALVIGPTRTGWTESFVIPNLLSSAAGRDQHQFVVVGSDDKAFDTTADILRRAGRRVVMIGRPVASGEGHISAWHLNPMDAITNLVSDVAALTKLIFGGSHRLQSSSSSAFATLQATISWVADTATWPDGTPFAAEQRNLDTARQLMADRFQPAAANTPSIRGLDVAGGEAVAFEAHEGGISDQELSDMLRGLKDMTYMSRTGLATYKLVGDYQVETSFQPCSITEMLDGKTDIFVRTREERRSPWNALHLWALTRALSREHRRNPGNKLPVLTCMVDDAANVGGLPWLADISGVSAGWGINLILRLHNEMQIKDHLGKDEANILIANAEARVDLVADWPHGDYSVGRVTYRDGGVRRFRKPRLAAA